VPNADCQELGEYHGTVKWYSPEALRTSELNSLLAASQKASAHEASSAGASGAFTHSFVAPIVYMGHQKQVLSFLNFGSALLGGQGSRFGRKDC
jgi:hypothetical protein